MSPHLIDEITELCRHLGFTLRCSTSVCVDTGERLYFTDAPTDFDVSALALINQALTDRRIYTR